MVEAQVFVTLEHFVSSNNSHTPCRFFWGRLFLLFLLGFFFFCLFFLVFFLSWKIERSWSEGKEMGGRGQLREDFLSMRLLSSIQSYPSLMIPAINKFFQCGEWSLLAGLRKVALVWHFFSLFSSLTILKITCWHAGTECIS